MDEKETEAQAPQTQPTQEPKLESVTPEVIKPTFDKKTIEELTQSINELKAVEKALYEQQNIMSMKGVQDNEENELTY